MVQPHAGALDSDTSLAARLSDAERTVFRELVAILEPALRKRYARATMLRGAHPKPHGLVRASFEIHEGLPPDLAVGLFAQARAFPAWVRFSNAGALPSSDRAKDIRGVAIKVMDVDGDKFLPSETHTQDFLLQSSNRFIVATPAEFVGLSRWIVRGFPMGFFLTRPRYLMAGLKALIAASNPFALTYWSAVPFRHGPAQAVKYILQPATQLDPEIGSGPDAMRNAMKALLAEREVCFSFCVQRQADPESAPIENAWQPWDESVSPGIPLATLRIPAQRFDSDAQMAFCENLSFSPWHAIRDHEPLGAMNRVRGALYEVLSRYRRSVNDVSQVEPTGRETFEE